MIESVVKTFIQTRTGGLVLSRIPESDTYIYTWKAVLFDARGKELRSAIGNEKVLDLLEDCKEEDIFPYHELEEVNTIIDKVIDSIENRKKFKYI